MMRRASIAAFCTGLLAASVAHADAPGTTRSVTPVGVLDVATSDSRGAIRIDGSAVGVGAYHGDVAPGPHEIAVERSGFKPYKKTIVVESGKTESVVVSLEREEAAAPPPPPPDAFGGFYGGFFLGPSFEPGGSGSTFEQSCSLIGAASCSANAPAGFTLAAHVGYTWDPVGIEIFGAFGLDYSSPSATFDGQVAPGSNIALSGPARVEQFRVVRTGGMAALRARATIDGKTVRVSFAAGAGFGAHVMAFDRTATTTDGTNKTDVFATQPISYVSPALSFEVQLAVRVSKGVAISAGVSTWLENAGQNTVTPADPQHYFVPSFTPLRTPSYRLAGAAQFFVWPFVGLQFGP